MAKAGIRITVVVGLLAALGAPLPVAAQMNLHYDCRVTGTSHLDRRAKSHDPEVSDFTCRITGGLLDGFVATGTNIMEPQEGGSRLVGSIIVAQKAGSIVVYEVSEATRRLKTIKGGVLGWESTSVGTYKLATGSAAPLAGKSFSAVARSGGPGVFTIDVVVRMTGHSEAEIRRSH
jgi:hypothetical protein